MKLYMLIFLSLGLAADAAAVSVANGIAHPRRPVRLAFSCGLCFGLFQGVMPFLGSLAGGSFLPLVRDLDHWAAMGLLSLIGGRMIACAVRQADSPPFAPPSRLSAGALLLQALATSVDALAVGVGLGIMGVGLAPASALIGAVTFACCFLAVLLGRLAGRRFCRRAQLAGGCILVLTGLHILAGHLNLLPY